MTWECKLYCQHCVKCNNAIPDQRGGASLQPLGNSNFPWKIVGIDYVIDLPNNGLYGSTSVFIMVCNLTKMSHFVPRHNELVAEETSYLFRSNCYRLHGAPKVIVSDRESKFVRKLWQSFLGKLNTKLNVSTARHPSTYGLTERVNQSMQTLLRCNCT